MDTAPKPKLTLTDIETAIHTVKNNASREDVYSQYDVYNAINMASGCAMDASHKIMIKNEVIDNTVLVSANAKGNSAFIRSLKQSIVAANAELEAARAVLEAKAERIATFEALIHEVRAAKAVLNEEY
jgi:hypothetical protein